MRSLWSIYIYIEIIKNRGQVEVPGLEALLLNLQRINNYPQKTVGSTVQPRKRPTWNLKMDLWKTVFLTTQWFSAFMLIFHFNYNILYTII